MGRARSRSVSTTSGFKGGRSYEFTSNGGTSAGDSSGGAYQNIAKNKNKNKGETLEGRFGGKLFSGGKKGGGNNGGSGGNLRTFTSSQRRVIYPGLSIASTQNRSIGVVTLDDNANDVQMHPMPPPHVPSNPKTGNRDFNERNTTAVERAQDGAMSVSTDITGYSLGDSMSISNAHVSSHSGQPLMTDSGTRYTTSPSDSLNTSNRRANGRPSTAPTSGGQQAYHLPSGWRRGSLDRVDGDAPNDGNPQTNPQLHEYPPDAKGARNDRRTVNRIDEDTDVYSDEDNVPPIREDMFPQERSDDVTDTEVLSSWDRRVVVDHPYATAQSPHVDAYDDTGRQIRGPSVSHPYSDPLASSAGERGPHGRRRGVEESPTIIRHTDAGRIRVDDDEESHDSRGRRRVVELPPAYGEISTTEDRRGGRPRDRA
jgi:hypothetical protein